MIELRAEGGRRLVGTVIVYGEVADPGGFAERFQPGSLAMNDVMLNVQHDRGRMVARTPQTLRLLDSETELRMVATLPETREADDVLALVASGVLRGLSVGFVARRERQEGDLRIIEAAILDHVAIVDRPAYAGSVVDTRRRLITAVGRPNQADRAAARRSWREGRRRWL